MKEHIQTVIWPIVVKTVVPALLGGLGATFAATNSEWFRAFCGLS